MTTPRQQQPPSHIVAMIAGAVMGELLLLLGLLWFLWRNASDSCADAGGRAVGSVCEFAGAAARPLHTLLPSWWWYAVVGLFVVSTAGTLRFVADAGKRAAAEAR